MEWNVGAGTYLNHLLPTDLFRQMAQWPQLLHNFKQSICF